MPVKHKSLFPTFPLLLFLTAMMHLSCTKQSLPNENYSIKYLPVPEEALTQTTAGPRAQLKPFFRSEPVTWELEQPLGDRGNVAFWFKPDRDFRIGEGASRERVPLLEIKDLATVELEQKPHIVRLVIRWDEGIQPARRDMEILLPEILGDTWYHLAFHWDAAAGQVNAFLDGSPYHWTDRPVSSWTIDRESKKITAYANRFAIAGVTVAPRPLKSIEIASLVGSGALGKSDRLMGAKKLSQFNADNRRGDLLYASSMRRAESVKDWKLEGPGEVTFTPEGMVLESQRPNGPEGNVVYWCPEIFPASFIAEWNFRPLSEQGLCIAFFAAQGRNGEDLFDPSLEKRSGVFGQYIKGDINAYHISYYANTPEVPRRTANLRKNHGFYLVSNGPVGVPPDSDKNHRVVLFKDRGHIRMSVDGNTIIDYVDDGKTTGAILGHGRMGLRQMQWTRGLYSDFQVFALAPAPDGSTASDFINPSLKTGMGDGPEYRVGPPDMSSAIGFYGVSPESPDGQTIAYVRYLEDPEDSWDHVPGELWISDRNNLSDQRKLADIGGVCSHNGVELQWASNELIVIRDRPKGEKPILRVIDAETGEHVHPPLVGIGSIGHDIWEGKALFSINRKQVSETFPQAGIYEFDVSAGKHQLLINLAQIGQAMQDHYGATLKKLRTLPWEDWTIRHLKKSPTGNFLMFRLDVAGKAKEGRLLVTCRPDGSDLTIVEPKLNHAQWQKDDILAGHAHGFGPDSVTRPLMLTNHRGDTLSTIGTSGNHLAINVAGTHYATETRNDRSPVRLLFGDLQTGEIHELSVSTEIAPIAKIKFHMNPAFSRDGTRAYYNKPLNRHQSGVYYFDLARITENQPVISSVD